MTASLDAQVLVVGGGPGGYVAAIRAGQLGLKTVLVEGRRLGGTCLVRGCIPSKALIHAAETFASMTRSVGTGALGIRLDAPPHLDLAATMGWKDGIVDRLSGGVGTLLKRAGVQVLAGWGTFSDAKTCLVEGEGETVEVRAEHVILATGSESVPVPTLPFGGPVISSTEALSLDALPQRLVVIGAGYIGLELGTAFAKLGSAVTVIERLGRILPQYDAELTGPVRHWLERAGVALHLGASAEGVAVDGAVATVTVATAEGGKLALEADRVLVTVGRRPLTRGWGLETMAVDRDGPFVRVDETCRTSMRGVYAIGDLVGEPMLAHKASAQGEFVAELIAGRRGRFAPAAIPAVCFTDPEIVSVGLSPDAAAAQGLAVETGSFPYRANGRAMTLGSDDGFVRVVARRDNHRILGIQAVGPQISEMAGEFALAIEMGAVLEDIAGTIHAHPTLGEAFHESALRTLGHAIHI